MDFESKLHKATIMVLMLITCIAAILDDEGIVKVSASTLAAPSACSLGLLVSEPINTWIRNRRK